MTDYTPNFDFLGDCNDVAMDQFLPDYNFDLNNDFSIEDTLAQDYPADGVQQTPVPEVSSTPQLQGALLNTPFLSNEGNPQLEFVDPRITTHEPPPMQSFENFSNGNMIDPNWIENELAKLSSDPSIYGYVQDPSMMGAPIYTNNNQLGLDQQGLYISYGMPQQPMLYPTNVTPMGFMPPHAPGLTNTYMNVQQHTSTPVGYQQNPQQPIHSSPLPVIHETNARASVRQSPARRPTQAAPKGRGSPGRVSPNSGRDSSLPTRKNRSRHSQVPPSPGTTTTQPTPKRPAKNHLGEPLRNDKIPRKTHGKKANTSYPEPEMFYGPSPPRPQSWGPRNSKGEHLFTYTEKGELAAGLYLSALEMRQYLLGPSPGDDFDPPARLPGVKLARNKVRQGLTLWIGWPAAQANFRYPRQGESFKCRFANCQFAKHTIALGQPWVIFDERQNVDGEIVDPFHNAGYAHLWCLESNFDLIDLWHLVDIRPDYRTLKRESHPYFSLEHKLNGIDLALRNWWITTYEKCHGCKGQGIKRQRDYATSLAARLVKYKIKGESASTAKTREKRKGNDFTKHHGDPELIKKYALYKQYNLLDEHGYPTPDAAAQLEYIERVQEGAGRNPVMNLSACSSPELLAWVPTPQGQPSRQATVNMPPKGSRGRKRGREDNADAENATTPSSKRPRLQKPSAAQPSRQENLNMPPEGPRGRKRGRESTVDAENTITPSSKRPRLQKPSAAPQPSTAEPPVAPLPAIGNAVLETHAIASTPPGEEANPATAANNSTHDTGVSPPFPSPPSPPTSPPPSSPIIPPPTAPALDPEPSSPTFSSKEAQMSADDMADLFGEDVEYEEEEVPTAPTLPTPPASPQRLGRGSPFHRSEGGSSTTLDGIEWVMEP